MNHTAFTHELVDPIEMSRLENQLKHEDMVDNYIESRQSKLSTFLTLHCIYCEVELEDGERVVKLECNSEHVYHVECL